MVGAQQFLAIIDEQFGPDSPNPPKEPLTLPQRCALAQAAAYQANVRVFEQLAKQQGRLQRMMGALQKYMNAVMEQRHRPAAAAAASDVPVGFVRAPIPQMPVFSGPMAEIKRKQWLRQHGIVAK